MKDVRSLVRENVLRFTPYSAARDSYKGSFPIYMDSNENPLDTGFNRYPDPRQTALKKRVSEIKGVSVDQMFIGNGSDEAIDLTYRIFCEPKVDNSIFLSPSYGMYLDSALLNEVEPRVVQLGPDYSLPVEKLLAAADEHSKLMFICSPNNPTGNAFAKDDLLRLVNEFNGIVIVDEAYIDYSSKESMLNYLDTYPNLMVMQTLSKAWGMAGLRLGLAFGSKEMMTIFASVKYPYNISSASIESALKLLDRNISKEVAETVNERTRMAKALEGVNGVEKVFPSDANFILFRCKDACKLFERLMGEDVIVRDRCSVPGCADCLRVTVGLRSENDVFLEIVRKFYGTFGTVGKGENASKTADDRIATVTRYTKETRISATVDLDGKMPVSINTGLHFFDHMLDQIAHHSGVSLQVKALGDLEVDEHHTMEDVAITLGEALYKALGDKKGLERYGFSLPMDDCSAMVLLDLGGRIDFEWDVNFTREYVGDVPTEMFRHFFKSLSESLHCNLHIVAKGENNHHLAEAVFKAFARSLRQAVRRDVNSDEIPTSKGQL